MVEISQSQGRYFLLDSGPVASPGHCVICGYSGADRVYIDPRLDFEWYGSAIFCEECVGSMARLFNFLEPAQALALERRVEEAERELVTLRATALAIEGLRVAIGDPSLVYANNFRSGNGDVAVRDDDAEPELPFESDRQEGSDHSGPDEQDSKPRSDDVSNIEWLGGDF
jgi:hypothetical protein